MTTKTARPEIPETIGRTKVTVINPMSIVGAGLGFIADYDGVINPYSGCSFGCDYCYASNFTKTQEQKDTWGGWVNVKANAVQQLNRVGVAKLNNKTFYISTVTDPYQPVEKKAEITRGILEAMVERKATPKLVIQTRSPLVTRDIDLFQQIERQGGRVQVNMTITTDDDEVRRLYEPGCPTIHARTKAITEVHQAGIQSCITMTPLLPLADARSFARNLKATGVSRFIVQGFHLQPKANETMIARTDARAIASTAKHFRCSPAQAPKLYYRKFQDDLVELRKEITHMGMGKEGFKPPF